MLTVNFLETPPTSTTTAITTQQLHLFDNRLKLNYDQEQNDQYSLIFTLLMILIVVAVVLLIWFKICTMNQEQEDGDNPEDAVRTPLQQQGRYNNAGAFFWSRILAISKDADDDRVQRNVKVIVQQNLN